MENVVLFKDHSKAQGEIANMNRKLNTMRQHVERLEKETATKDHAIALVQSERKKQKQLDCNKKSSSSIEVREFDIDGGGWSIKNVHIYP